MNKVEHTRKEEQHPVEHRFKEYPLIKKHPVKLRIKQQWDTESSRRQTER